MLFRSEYHFGANCPRRGKLGVNEQRKGVRVEREEGGEGAGYGRGRGRGERMIRHINEGKSESVREGFYGNTNRMIEREEYGSVSGILDTGCGKSVIGEK